MKINRIDYVDTEVKYCRMDKDGHIIRLFTDTYEDAVKDAKFDQPTNRPYKILKVTTVFEEVGEVK